MNLTDYKPTQEDLEVFKKYLIQKIKSVDSDSDRKPVLKNEPVSFEECAVEYLFNDCLEPSESENSEENGNVESVEDRKLIVSRENDIIEDHQKSKTPELYVKLDKISVASKEDKKGISSNRKTVKRDDKGSEEESSVLTKKKRPSNKLKSPERDRPLQCSFCPSTFKKYYWLTEHIRKRHDSNFEAKDRAFKCDHCLFRTNYTTSLKVHVKTKHGKNPCKCLQCDYTTENKRSFKLHQNACHLTNNDSDDEDNLSTQSESKTDGDLSKQTARNANNFVLKNVKHDTLKSNKKIEVENTKSKKGHIDVPMKKSLKRFSKSHKSFEFVESNSSSSDEKENMTPRMINKTKSTYKAIHSRGQKPIYKAVYTCLKCQLKVTDDESNRKIELHILNNHYDDDHCKYTEVEVPRKKKQS